MARRLRPPWLIQPIAHRGLHDARRGIIENTASAFTAAMAADYAIETDIRAAAGGEPVVFHDTMLDRLTESTGPVAAQSATMLSALPLKRTGDRILGLGDFLDLIAGRVPVFIEIKSAWSGDRALERKTAALLANYRGPVAVMSFDPGVLLAMRAMGPRLPLGLASMRFTAQDWPQLSPLRRFRLTHLLDFPGVKPDFLAYDVRRLPNRRIALLRRRGVPVLSWTVRSQDDRRRAKAHADAMIFEGFRPGRGTDLSQT